MPDDLTGKTVLDIGCNGGFYAIEMKRRNAARVVAIDIDPDYLRQARFAARVLGIEIEFERLSVYDVAKLGERFDIVLFLGRALPPAPSIAGARPDPGARRPRSLGLPVDAARLLA